MEFSLFDVPITVWVLFLVSTGVAFCCVVDRIEFLVRQRAFFALVKQKTSGFPYLADAWVEYLAIQDGNVDSYLRTKKRPAIGTADKLKEANQDRRQILRTAKLLEYRIKKYEGLFPWLRDYCEEGIDDALLAIREDAASTDYEARDPVQRWLTDAQYNKLTVQERNQLALDRYQSRKRSNWEIGRDYERFVGYVLEQDGYRVEYIGAIEGLDDLGRDLIARKGREVKLIQCKYWADRKEIREKHVFQLFGTAVEYALSTGLSGRARFGALIGREDDRGVQPAVYTSTSLSSRAREYATILGISVEENFKLSSYPLIKCNISKRDSTRIYHLPFDQQYDRVRIEKARGEFYAQTVEQAEKSGFRRALEWHPNRRAA